MSAVFYMAVTQPDLARFLAKVDRSESCWVWMAALNRGGYGLFRFKGRLPLAHRFAYSVFVGPITDNLTVDHVCRNRRCVRPDHLRLLTRGENALAGDGVTAENKRKTHCPAGHRYAGNNLRLGSRGPGLGRYRRCRECHNHNVRNYYKRKREIGA